MRAAYITGKNPCREAIFGVIRTRHHIPLIIKIQNAENGPKDFLARDRHLIADICKHGRRQIIARALKPPPAADQPRALGNTLRDKPLNNLHLPITDQRAKICGFIEWIADHHLFKPRA